MSKRLVDQLRKVTRVDIPEPPEQFNTILIPKQEDLSTSTLNVGDQLLIEVPTYITDPPPTFDLHQRWNNNQVPPERVMQAVVVKTLGKMVYVNTMSYSIEEKQTTGHPWAGWLPRSSIKIKARYGG